MIDFNQKKLFFYKTFFEHKIVNKIFNNPEEDINSIIKEWENKSNLPFDKDLLAFEYLKLNIVMQKEHVVSNGKNDYELRVNDNVVNELISEITKNNYNGGSFNFGGYDFDDPIKFINIIRNKFAHGDYTHDESKEVLIFNVNNVGVEIDMHNLLTMALNIFYVRDIHNVDGFFHKILVVGKSNNSRVSSYSGFKSLIKNTRIISFNVSPKINGIKLNDYEIEKIDKLTTDIAKVIRACGYNSNEHILLKKNLEYFCNEKKLNLKIGDSPLSSFEDEKIEKLKILYLNGSNIFNEYDADLQRTFVSQWLDDIIVKKEHGELTNDGLTILADFAFSIGDYKNGLDFFQNNPIFATCYDKMFICNLISHFYSMYAYDFEDVFKSYTDFSLLDLNNINPIINKIENNEMLGLPEKRKKCIDAINKCLREIKKIETGITNYPDKKDGYLKGLKIINEQLNENNLKLKEIDEEIDKAHKSQFGKANNISNGEKYLKNKFIISHLRNCIAHGNVVIERYQRYDCIADLKIHFFDIYNGENTFDITITVKEFADILSEYNANILFKSYDAAISDKKDDNNNMISQENSPNKKSFIKKLLTKLKR